MADNKENIWTRLTPGMKFAAIIGAFFISFMHKGFMIFISQYIRLFEIKFILAFLALFFIPLIYVQGVGIVIATLYDLIFKKKK